MGCPIFDFLHTSHGYPPEKKSEKMRTVRAVFVDAMAFLMCFWLCRASSCGYSSSNCGVPADGGHRIAARNRVCLERDVPVLYGEVRE